MMTNAEKISIFKSFFTGSSSAYGTYNYSTGKYYQIKKSVTDDVVLQHLLGRQSYGLYPLNGEKTSVLVIDFDTGNKIDPLECVNASKHYGLSSYIECSKSKGYHVWTFFEGEGVSAAKVRCVAKLILEHIGKPDTEIFPKQNVLDYNAPYGSFINAPLFGTLVPKGKTVFVDPITFDPYANQWIFLQSVQKHNESTLDEVIEINKLSYDRPQVQNNPITPHSYSTKPFGLPPCAQLILEDGVSKRQRCVCFRLAVHLKRLGFPRDSSIALLAHWAQKNRPEDPQKNVITEREIISQVSYAFGRNYTTYGCDKDEVKPFCQPECPINLARSKMYIR